MILGDDFIKATCKIGQGHACCRYLGCGPRGFECLKLTDTKAYLDKRVAEGTMTARADNCEGKPPEGSGKGFQGSIADILEKNKRTPDP